MKKWLIIYTSNTNNTKQIAEAMFSAVGPDSKIISSKEFETLDDYDVVAVGFWVTRGGPDPVTRGLLPKINHKQVVLFQTLGAEPSGEHAVTSLAKAAYLLGGDCTIVGTFSTRGKINPVLLEKRKHLSPQNPHAYHEENMRRWAAAASHPDETDRANARAFVAKIERKLALREAYENRKEVHN